VDDYALSRFRGPKEHWGQPEIQLLVEEARKNSATSGREVKIQQIAVLLLVFVVGSRPSGLASSFQELLEQNQVMSCESVRYRVLLTRDAFQFIRLRDVQTTKVSQFGFAVEIRFTLFKARRACRDVARSLIASRRTKRASAARNGRGASTPSGCRSRSCSTSRWSSSCTCSSEAPTRASR
jgi:hypothetical protein